MIEYAVHYYALHYGTVTSGPMTNQVVTGVRVELKADNDQQAIEWAQKRKAEFLSPTDGKVEVFAQQWIPKTKKTGAFRTWLVATI